MVGPSLTVELEIVVVDWLSFTPKGGGRRGAQRPLGAHAFEPDGPEGQGSLSLCGYVDRAKAGPVAPHTARHCVWCERVFAGRAKPVDRWTKRPRGWK